jgi:hypothetical protein
MGNGKREGLDVVLVLRGVVLLTCGGQSMANSDNSQLACARCHCVPVVRPMFLLDRLPEHDSS